MMLPALFSSGLCLQLPTVSRRSRRRGSRGYISPQIFYPLPRQGQQQHNLESL